MQNVDLVIEGTGVFVNSEGAGKHLQAGAKKVSTGPSPLHRAWSLTTHCSAALRRITPLAVKRRMACPLLLPGFGTGLLSCVWILYRCSSQPLPRAQTSPHMWWA